MGERLKSSETLRSRMNAGGVRKTPPASFLSNRGAQFVRARKRGDVEELERASRLCFYTPFGVKPGLCLIQQGVSIQLAPVQHHAREFGILRPGAECLDKVIVSTTEVLERGYLQNHQDHECGQESGGEL